MIYFTGDIHGDVERFYPYNFNEQKALTKNDYMVICGDFGLIWDCEGTNPFEEEKLDYLENRSYTTLFVDGNHECYDRLNKYPIEEWHGGLVQKIRPSVIHLMRGQIYDIDGATILAFGGAESHDISDGILDQNDYKTEADFMDEYMKMRNTGKMFRVNHVSWWKEELPTDEEIALAKENLAKHNNKVDYIVTHDTSSRILHKMYDNCGGCTPNRLNDFFDWIENNIEYKHWFFGHHHINKDLDEKTTCLYYSIVFERIKKKVGVSVIQSQIRKFQIPFYNEGWDNIVLSYRKDDVKSVLSNRFDDNGCVNTYFKQMLDAEQNNPHHNETVGNHSLTALKLWNNNYSDKYNIDYDIAVKYHDVGKLFTQTTDENDISHFYNHEKFGTYLMLENINFFTQLIRQNHPILTQKEAENIFLKQLFLVNYHMMPFAWEKQPRRYDKDLKLFGKDNVELLKDFNECDRFREKDLIINKENNDIERY